MPKRIQLSTQREIINPATGQRARVSTNEYTLLRGISRQGIQKEALISMVWGVRALQVSDSSYYNLLYRLRRSLASIGLENVVLTMPTYGVALDCEVELVLSQPLPFGGQG